MSNENVEKNESMFEPIKNDESRVDALKHNKEKLEGLGLERTETCCPSSLASDDGTVYCDTGDLIDDILGMPRCTPEEKAARRERSRKHRERLMELERENQEWQKFRRKYLLEAEERARRDYEALKSSRKTGEELIFGHTSEEFDKIYDENNGFNETYPGGQEYNGSEEVDRHNQEVIETSQSGLREETVFGYTRKEFDELYKEKNGFNVSCPDDGLNLGIGLGEMLKSGSESLVNGSEDTSLEDKGCAKTRKPGRFGDWRDYI